MGQTVVSGQESLRELVAVLGLPFSAAIVDSVGTDGHVRALNRYSDLDGDDLVVGRCLQVDVRQPITHAERVASEQLLHEPRNL